VVCEKGRPVIKRLAGMNPTTRGLESRVHRYTALMSMAEVVTILKHHSLNKKRYGTNAKAQPSAR